MNLAIDTLERIVRNSRGGLDPTHVQDATLAAAELLLSEFDEGDVLYGTTANVVARIIRESTVLVVNVRAARIILEHDLERVLKEVP